jgi:two-component system, NtrC family, sensor kinase
MPRKLGPKLIFSLTVLIVAISGISGYLNFRSQKKQLVDTMILGADQLSRGITGATWHAMLDDDRKAAYQIMRSIADKQGVDRIRMFNREGTLVFSTDAREQTRLLNSSSEVCATCHDGGSARTRPADDSRVRYAISPNGVKTINMVAPIYNEPSCSNASCHAHSPSTKVLGVVDVALSLDPVKAQTRAITFQTILWTILEVGIGAAFVILFTRRFVASPIQQLIAGTKAVSAMELDRSIDVGAARGTQEFDELVASFNRMRERLKFAIAELNDMQQTLETKVDERTQQLKAAQNKLVQSDRLATLGQLAASVAHEINNPISGVLNLSMLLERLMASGNYPAGREVEFRKYLGMISTETARVGRIVSDLLAFSRRSKPHRAPADLNKLVQTTIGLIDHKLKLISAQVALDLQAGLPLVECDSSQIQQVILNLVLNGAQAMQSRGGGILSVRTHLIANEGIVELAVHDNGEGIAPENISKIFDPFFTTKVEGKGVGLGLAVLYGIVKAHEGEVEVVSRPNEGTTFTVILPLRSRGVNDSKELQVQAV